MSFNIKNLDQAINDAQKLLDKLQAKKKVLNSMPQPKALAIQIHEQQCSHDHTVFCPWFYEIKDDKHDWNQTTHKEFLEKATELLEVSDYETLVKILNILH